MVEGESKSPLLRDFRIKAENEFPTTNIEDKNAQKKGIKLYRAMVHLRKNKSDGEKQHETEQEKADAERAAEILKSVYDQFIEHAEGEGKQNKVKINDIKADIKAEIKSRKIVQNDKEYYTKIKQMIDEKYGKLNFYNCVKSYGKDKIPYHDVIYLGKLKVINLNFTQTNSSIERDDSNYKYGSMFYFEERELFVEENTDIELYSLPSGKEVEGGRKRKTRRNKRKGGRKSRKSRKMNKKTNKRRRSKKLKTRKSSR